MIIKNNRDAGKESVFRLESVKASHHLLISLTLPGVNARGFFLQPVGLLVDVTTCE
jgi:hypothetical protein